MEFDFVRRTLTLARRPLLGRGSDAIPLIDLRPLGAPVATYALKVKRLVANGQEMPLKGPVVAVVDTGTTGLVISDSLYDSDEFPLPGTRCAARVSSYTPTSLSHLFPAHRHSSAHIYPLLLRLVFTGAAVRKLDVEVATESGKTITLSANRKRRSDEVSETFIGPLQTPRAEEFDLLTTPVQLSWFDKGSKYTAPGTPHVIFVGLAFLSKLKLTIDADEMRMATKVIEV